MEMAQDAYRSWLPRVCGVYERAPHRCKLEMVTSTEINFRRINLIVYCSSPVSPDIHHQRP
jgi:hypothetical protein